MDQLRNPDNDDLPVKYMHRHIGQLIHLAKPRGLIVTALGAEQYSVADERGRVMLREGTFGEAQHVTKFGASR